MKTILVCGGRDYEDWLTVSRTLDKICYDRGWTSEPDQYGNCLPRVKIVTGGCEGADTLAEDWAVINWCPSIKYEANWKKHGKAAGPIRNKLMLDSEPVDLVVAFPGGRGTANMVSFAKERNIEVVEVNE